MSHSVSLRGQSAAKAFLSASLRTAFAGCIVLAAFLGQAPQLSANSLPLGGQTATIAPMEVDVELVLAVDVSFSMDADEQRIQRQGYLDAIRSPEFTSAVRNGALGKVAISYLEWGGIGSTDVIVPWTIIEDEAGARAFADQLEARPIQQLPRTSISGAIRRGVELIKSNTYRGLREVIDISGDGPNNAGQPVAAARDWAREQGIIINGLPLMMKRDTNGLDLADLDLYYRDCVITGPGAFMIPVRGKEEFRDAIRTKIIREIAAVPAPDSLSILLASEESGPRADCMAGEMSRKYSVPRT
jgi:hypothetical protein